MPKVHRESAPHVPDHIEAQLRSMHPMHFLRWNGDRGCWEIWIELRERAHPDAENQLAETDRWNTDEQCFMRKLQNYVTAEGGYAPANQGLITGLQMCDAWLKENFYEENFESEEERIQAMRQILQKASAASTRYYKDFDNPKVGRHTTGDWRHRYR